MLDKKIVFMGTPEFSVPVLEALIKETNVVLVVTMPDKAVGRKQVLTPSPIKQIALKNNIEVFTPTKIKNDYEIIKNLKPDLIITCAYGGILPKELLEIPKYGSINVHASILPKYRGASPIHSAIINDEKESGITIMYMDEGMDTGDIIDIEKVNIDENDNTGTLHDKLSCMAPNLLIKTLKNIFNNTNNRVKQDNNLSSYCYPLKKEDEHLNFNDTSLNIYNKIRGMNPYPGCYIIVKDNIIKIIESKISSNKSKCCGIINEINKDSISIGTKDYDLLITKIKPSGKKEMNVQDYLNGRNKEELIGEIIK